MQIEMVVIINTSGFRKDCPISLLNKFVDVDQDFRVSGDCKAILVFEEPIDITEKEVIF